MDVQLTEEEKKAEAIRKSEARARSLANLRPIKKGEVRNPTGRPKKDKVLADLAQQHAQTAIDTLVEVMTDREATPNARVSAASELLDRGFGRAPQSLEANVKVSFADEFEEFLHNLADRRANQGRLIDAEAEDID
jgi:hypothetical protein